MKINLISNTGYSLNLNSKNSKKTYCSHLRNSGCDSVSFGATRVKEVLHPVNVDLETARLISKSLANSTSGLRAPYMSRLFNPETVKLITLGVAEYAKEDARKKDNAADGVYVIIGGDTRKATRESLPLIDETLKNQGITVMNIKDPVPTPLLALSANKYKTNIAILMTASHNPWKDGGYNFITTDGAVAPTSVTRQISKNIIDIAQKGVYAEPLDPKGVSIDFDPYYTYLDEIEKLNLIDFDKIKKSGLEIYYDGLNGAGTYVMPKIFQEFGIPTIEVKSFGQESPNPSDENLAILKDTVKKSNAKLKIGLSNDGDADRFGIIDENGKFIEPNDVLLLAAYHLAKNKDKTGDIIRSQATSMQLDKLADLYRVGVNVTPVGFKYIAEDILAKRKHGRDILLAGEESGGLTVNGHIPEKDGIIANALIADLVATEGRPISEILKDIKKSLGTSFVTNNFSRKFQNEAKKNEILDRVCDFWLDKINSSEENEDFDAFHKIDKIATIIDAHNMKSYKPGGDGYKFILTDGSTVLVRKSGTEPLLRCYIEATGRNEKKAQENCEILKEKIEELFDV